MIDFHCHLLPDIDDGPSCMDDSVAMAAASRDAGFTKVCCTPHLIKGAYEADNQEVIETTSKLQARLTNENIAIELLPGREYYLDEFLLDYLKDPLVINQTRYVMIEIPGHASPDFVKDTLFRVKCGGFIPMISHPERCSLLFEKLNIMQSLWARLPRSARVSFGARPEELTLLEYLRDLGCAFQGNLGSFEGWYGPEVQKAAKTMKQKKIFTHFGTDAHNLRGIMRLPADIIQFNAAQMS